MTMDFKAWFSMLMIRLFGNIQVFWFQPLLFILWGSTHYKMKGIEMRKVMNNLQVGDILLRRYDRYVSGWFIKGYYKHAAIYVGDNQIVHATTFDIFKEDILTFLRCDAVAVLRIKDLQEPEKKHAVERATSFIGHGYDFDFKHSDKRYYCTSLVRWCYPDRFQVMDKKGKTIQPDDFWYQGLEVVHDSRQYREEHT